MAAMNVDRPLFTETFNVQTSSADYASFIARIRSKLGNPGHFSHNRPVLPPVEPNVAPSRWIHVVLKNSPTGGGLTIATRADNLYLEGFRSSDGTWWELTRGLIPGATHVGFGSSYGDLIGDADYLVNVPLGRQQMADAVTALYGRTRADLASGPRQQQAKEAVATLLLMVHEATRSQSVSGFVAGLLHPKALENRSGKITNEMKAQVNGWKDLSKALLKTDLNPPGRFTPIVGTGVTTAEQATAALGILLFVEVPGGLTVAQALQLFRANGGR